MFINVSNNLPKTSYMKMVDIWLLFNLFYPFVVVLLHTYMDTLRSDHEDEKNDKVIVTDNVHDHSSNDLNHISRLRMLQKLSLVYIPGFCFIFALMYWIIGLKQAEVFWFKFTIKQVWYARGCSSTAQSDLASSGLPPYDLMWYFCLKPHPPPHKLESILSRGSGFRY